jgi:hypothetical protein
MIEGKVIVNFLNPLNPLNIINFRLHFAKEKRKSKEKK